MKWIKASKIPLPTDVKDKTTLSIKSHGRNDALVFLNNKWCWQDNSYRESAQHPVREHELEYIEWLDESHTPKQEHQEQTEAGEAREIIAGVLYKNSTDESDEGAWIESQDYYKIAQLIAEALKTASSPIEDRQQEGGEWQLERLYEWLQNPDRQKAITAFTSGLTRNIASDIEFKLWGLQNELAEVRRARDNLKEIIGVQKAMICLMKKD